MPSHRALFVAGAGTEIGKTYVTAALTRWLVADGRIVRTLKPLASGVPSLDDPTFAESDTARLLTAQGLPITPATVAACSPWRFRAPLAPDLAAAQEGRRLSLDELVAWCAAQFMTGSEAPSNAPSIRPPDPEVPRKVPRSGVEGGLQQSPRALQTSFAARSHLAPQDEGADRIVAEDDPLVLIEGVGGLMSPVTADATGLDWVKCLSLPVLLVSGSYLGAVSHALTAVETLRAHAVPLLAIVVSESLDAPTPPDYVAGAIARRAGAPVAILHRGSAWPDALADVI